MRWESVLPGLWRFIDSCNVYAVQGIDGFVLIDAGTGAWLPHVDALPGPIRAVLLTHHFRDHAAGAARAAERGIAIHVPHGERDLIAAGPEHLRNRDGYIVYQNVWDHDVPIEPIPVTSTLRDYETVKLHGLSIDIIPLPGATQTQVGFAVNLPGGGKRVVFSGETIHSPGRVPRISPLQYNYSDLPGAGNVYFSSQRLRAMKPDALLPSLGEPILRDVGDALRLLQENLLNLCSHRPGMTQAMTIDEHEPALRRITEHVWQDLRSFATTWYVLSRSGKVLALDYGYHHPLFWASTPTLRNRRPLLHGLDALKKQFNIDRIDVVLVSHFHDDHICGIPLLQRLHGTECWAAENFADLIEKPDAHAFPCNWPEPIHVTRRLPLHKAMHWEEYEFHLAPMSGHTRFSSLISFEADGVRFAHTGDQYLFTHADGTLPNPSSSTMDFTSLQRMQNHVYRNGALRDGYGQSARWMLEHRPQIVLSGHEPAFVTNEAFFRHIHAWDEEYRQTHQRIMPLGDADEHWDLDSWGGFIWPYRLRIKRADAAHFQVTVRNPLGRSAELTVHLRGPVNWKSEPMTQRVASRAEVTLNMTITPAGSCDRQAIAAELWVQGRCFGQIAEALVTVD